MMSFTEKYIIILHIDYIYSKLAKFIRFFYELSHKLPVNCLKMLYFSFVHPHILYGVKFMPEHTRHILTN